MIFQIHAKTFFHTTSYPQPETFICKMCDFLSPPPRTAPSPCVVVLKQ